MKTRAAKEAERRIETAARKRSDQEVFWAVEDDLGFTVLGIQQFVAVQNSNLVRLADLDNYIFGKAKYVPPKGISPNANVVVYHNRYAAAARKAFGRMKLSKDERSAMDSLVALHSNMRGLRGLREKLEKAATNAGKLSQKADKSRE